MSINKGMMSSNTDMWETPQELFDAYNSVYDFDIDVCAVPQNAKCERYFTPSRGSRKMVKRIGVLHIAELHPTNGKVEWQI